MKPFEKITTLDMWTDPYISKQMLKYHLDTNNDIASRKLKTIQETCNFISDLVPLNSTICDFGCGPGLYTNILQRLGFNVIGVDVSKSSLDYARSQNDKVKYLNLDYVNDELEDQIDLAMMIYCDFGALPPGNQIKFLKNLRKSLKPKGIFIFDVFSNKRFNNLKEVETEYNQTDGFFMEGPAKILSKITKFNEDKVSLSYDKAIGWKTVELFNWDQHYTPKEIKKLLNSNDFEVIDYYSDTIGNADFSSNEIMMFICKKRQL